LNLKNSWQSKFVQHSLTLVAGATLAQAIPVLVSPLLTRLYTPSNFGNLAIYMTVISISSVIVTGRYELAVVLPENKRDSANVSVLTVIISFLASLLLFCLFLIFREFIFGFVKSEVLRNWLYVLPLIVFFQGVRQVFSYWLNKQKEYKNISMARVYQSITTSGSRVGLGFQNIGTAGLLYGNLLGSIVGGLVTTFFALKKNLNVFRNVTLKDLKTLAVRYNKFPKYSMGTGLINTVSKNIPVIALTGYFSAGIVGFYALANRILRMLMQLVGRSVSRVFYERASELANDKQKLGEASFKLYIRLLLIGISSLGIVMFFGDHLFAFVFGEKWTNAGNYARILSFWILFNFTASPLSFILTALEKQEKSFFWELLLFFVRVMPFLVGIILGFGAFKLLAAFSLLSGLYYFSFCIYTLYQVHVPIGKIVFNTLIILVGIGGSYGILRLIIF
jgi:O-antigen/teichoic acid export membrane protein